MKTNNLDYGKMNNKELVAKLTAKQKRFCDELLVDFRETEAAIRAGYSKNRATIIATRNLNNPKIQEYLRRIISNEPERFTLKRLLEELKKNIRKAEFYNQDTDTLLFSIDYDLFGKIKKISFSNNRKTLELLDELFQRYNPNKFIDSAYVLKHRILN